MGRWTAESLARWAPLLHDVLLLERLFQRRAGMLLLPVRETWRAVAPTGRGTDRRGEKDTSGVPSVPPFLCFRALCFRAYFAFAHSHCRQWSVTAVGAKAEEKR